MSVDSTKWAPNRTVIQQCCVRNGGPPHLLPVLLSADVAEHLQAFVHERGAVDQMHLFLFQGKSFLATSRVVFTLRLQSTPPHFRICVGCFISLQTRLRNHSEKQTGTARETRSLWFSKYVTPRSFERESCHILLIAASHSRATGLATSLKTRHYSRLYERDVTSHEEQCKVCVPACNC